MTLRKLVRLCYLPLLAVLAGCAGGQSGSEGGQGCVPSDEPFETAEYRGQRPAAAARQQLDLVAQDMYLTWWPTVPRASNPSLRVEFSDFKFAETTEVRCASFSVGVSFRVRAEEGGLDAEFAGTLVAFFEGEGALHAVLTEGSVSDDAVRADLPEDAGVALELHWEGDHITGELRSTSGQTLLAKLANQGAPPIRSEALPVRSVDSGAQPVALRAVCSAAQPTSPRDFASDSALIEAVAKRWLVCSGRSSRTDGFAGLVIDGLGHYHELALVEDQLVAKRGFGHEGAIVEREAAGLEDSALSWQGVHLLQTALSSDGNTLYVLAKNDRETIDLTFQASDLPVRDPQLPFAHEGRLGNDACMGGEADVQLPAASASELRARLVGRWLLCRGRFGLSREYAAVEFRADGGFHWLDARGEPLPMGTGSYEISDEPWARLPVDFQINVHTTRQNLVLHEPSFSRTPIKMAIHDEFQTVLSAL